MLCKNKFKTLKVKTVNVKGAEGIIVKVLNHETFIGFPEK